MQLSESQMKQIEKLTGDYLSVRDAAYDAARSGLLDQYVKEKYGGGSYRLPPSKMEEIEGDARTTAHNVAHIWFLERVTDRLLQNLR